MKKLTLGLALFLIGCSNLQPSSASFKVLPRSFDATSGDFDTMIRTATFGSTLTLKFD